MSAGELEATRGRSFATLEDRVHAELTAQLFARALSVELGRSFALWRGLMPGVPAPEHGTGAGFQQVIDGAAPIAGADFEYEVPGDVVMLPLSVMAQLTTSAVAGDRSVAVEYQDGDGERYCVSGAPVTVGASSTQSFCWHPQAGYPSWPIEDAAVAPLAVQRLYTPARLAIVVWDGDAGDRLDQIRIAAQFDPQPPA